MLVYRIAILLLGVVLVPDALLCRECSLSFDWWTDCQQVLRRNHAAQGFCYWLVSRAQTRFLWALIQHSYFQGESELLCIENDK